MIKLQAYVDFYFDIRDITVYSLMSVLLESSLDWGKGEPDDCYSYNGNTDGMTGIANSLINGLQVQTSLLSV